MTPRGVPSPDDESDIDAQWQDIVARLGDLEETEGPDREDRTTDGPDPDDDPGTPEVGAGAGTGAGTEESHGRGHTVRPSTPPPGPTNDPRGWAPDPEVEEAENHFVPPDPGPVLGGDPLLTGAWVVVVGAPLFVVASMIVWQEAPGWVLQVAGAAFLAAVGVLVWRMPSRRDEDDDDGPGAVV